MSFDVFFQGFVAGESSTGGSAAMLSVLLPHVTERKGAFLRIRVGDGEADIYLNDDGMMANHVTGGGPWDILVRGARAANWVILPLGCPTCLTGSGQREELPEGLEDDAVAVETGADLRAIVEGH